ncbi:MAG TPA: CRISPR-associated endoribonuclease Cas6 [Cyanobacteria bacterium UBA8803]|nr:CRISPR-associated endoribonuclease Cas6 [Cyanobacteria bacterium UBA9273]HBL57932.1 CRISPR-associated endoribonuclease Cas6 [Cyanobacteria bacterium UBA8803]
MPRPKRTKKDATPSHLSWPPDTELVGLAFELTPRAADYLYPQYAVKLHAWFLDQVRQTNPELSAYLHDSQSEKPFTISGLEGELLPAGKNLQLKVDTSYRWYLTALSKPVVEWLAQWVRALPEQIELRDTSLLIRTCKIALPPTTYNELFSHAPAKTLKLSFLTPTSFRRKGHHFPLPVPNNLFHSYLRRWNDFSNQPFDQDAFLAWVEEYVLIHRHRLESVKVVAGKKGSVTGFTGAIELGLAAGASSQPDFEQLFYALGQFAPYCGTGHKTTFGLGQTHSGWPTQETQTLPLQQSLLAQRITELTQQFLAQRKRQGGTRAAEIAETWATILARRECGESIKAIASDLEMPAETVKTYAKLARRALSISRK